MNINYSTYTRSELIEAVERSQKEVIALRSKPDQTKALVEMQRTIDSLWKQCNLLALQRNQALSCIRGIDIWSN